MEYSGRFSILVLGANGVGKTHWIYQNIKEIREENYKEYLISVDSALAEDNEKFWADIFRKADKKYLIIEEVEKLSPKSQEIIFNIISTENGKFGLKEKNLETRIVFTSCFQIDKLRNDRRHLSSKFYDRISQFVVTFPDFRETQRDIYSDFEETWKKFFNEQHEYHNKHPKNEEFKKWLNQMAENMYGNFRDLDKIVMNWNLRQVSSDNMTEEEIFEIVKKDFNEILKFPTQSVYDDNSFVFIEDTKYEDILYNFKMKLKEWCLHINNNDKMKAAKMLGVSHRTMERWN